MDQGSTKQLLVKTKKVFNVGSVGEPLDGPEACYLIMDLDTGEGEICHVPYDTDETVKRMKDAGVPEFVIERFEQNIEITFKDHDCLC